jgi:hypothetical protein
MHRLKAHYVREASRAGIELRVFNGPEANLAEKVGAADAVILFTGKVSHRARREVVQAARSRGIPVLMRHSCGLCTLKDCLRCLTKERGGCVDA